MSKIISFSFCFYFLFFLFPFTIKASDYVPGEVIVKFKDSSVVLNSLSNSTNIKGIDSENSKHFYSKALSNTDDLIKSSKKISFSKVSSIVPLGTEDIASPIGVNVIEPGDNENISSGSVKGTEKLNKIFKFNFDKNEDINSVIQEIKKDPNVEYAEPNYKATIYSAPNDPLYNLQWGFNETQGSSVEKAWSIKDTAPSVKICIVDSGITNFYTDFASDIFWTNPSDPINNIDDDKNGYIDDVNGWNFQAGNNKPFLTINDHGTLVAAIINATKNNNSAQAGVLTKSQIITVTVASSLGDFNIATAIPAVKYAADSGCKIMNNSWGGLGNSSALAESFTYAKNKGVLVVNASGNSGLQIDKSSNFSFPSSYDMDNFINVGSYNSSNSVSDFSNYSNSLVHIAAPGEKIPFAYYATSGQYTLNDGTSFAAPFVTAVAALIWEKNPSWTYLQVKNAILNGSDTVSTWTNKIQNGRKLNAYKAVTYTSTSTTTFDVDGNGIVNLMDIFKHIKYVFDLPYDAKFDYNGRTPITPEDTFILIKQVFK